VTEQAPIQRHCKLDTWSGLAGGATVWQAQDERRRPADVLTRFEKGAAVTQERVSQGKRRPDVKLFFDAGAR
jgi:hypothetical protein